MFKFVGDVFVGKFNAGTAINSLAVNDIVVINENGAVVTAATAATAKSLRIVKVTGKNTVTDSTGTATTISLTRTSDELKKSELFTPAITSLAYAAATEKVVAVNFTSATIPTGYDRIVVRVVYRDVEGTKTQISKTFDYVSVAAPLAMATAGAELAKRINKHSGGTLTAAYASNTLTITGLPKTDNEGKDSINEYSQNEFEVSVFVTNTSSWITAPAIIPGVTITTTTPAFKGAGTAKLVRDAEKASIPYQGNENFIHIPLGTPGLSVDMAKTYDTIIVEFNKKYRSSYDQFEFTTPKKLEIFTEAGTGANIVAILNAFYNSIENRIVALEKA